MSLKGGINPMLHVILRVYSPRIFFHMTQRESFYFQVTLQDQQRETSLLAKRLGLAAKENQDLAE